MISDNSCQGGRDKTLVLTPPGVRPNDVAVSPVRLAVFCAVAEHRNFTRAADALNLTQPTVSEHIQVLEQVFGARLFERNRRGAQLTEAGRVVYEYAVPALQELAAVRGRLAELAGGRGGWVTLGAVVVPAVYVLPGLLAVFHHLYPSTYVRLRLLDRDVVAEGVLRGRLDFGIVNEAVLAPELQAEPIWADEIVVVARPDHRLASLGQVALTHIAEEPFVGGGVPTPGDQLLDQALARAGLGPRRIVMQIGSLEGVKQAVSTSVGLAIAFRQTVAAELEAGELVVLPLEQPLGTERFVLIWHGGQRPAPLAETLMAFIRSEIVPTDLTMTGTGRGHRSADSEHRTLPVASPRR